MKALVTGASGFIGSHLVRALLSDHYTVFAWSRKRHGGWRLQDLQHPSLRHQRIDLTDKSAITAALKSSKPDVIFHLASFRNPERSRLALGPSLQNLTTSVNLWDALLASKVRVRSIINTGSSEEYGQGRPPLKENAREAPVSPYSASKTASTHYAEMLSATFGLPITTLRLFLTYGPWQNDEMFIPSLIRHCLQGKDFDMTAGKQLRDFNFVSDTVSAYLLAAQSPRAVGQTINICSGKPHTLLSVAEKIVQRTGTRIKLRKGALPYRAGESALYGDPSKAWRLLKWRSTTPLEEGLERTIASFQK